MFDNCALVLEGGGMKGIYTSGVLDMFMEADIEFNHIIGVSAGALNASSYISHQKFRSKSILTKFFGDKRYMSFFNLIKEKSFFGVDFVYNEIPNKLNKFDYESFYKSRVKLDIVITNVITGKCEYIAKEDTTENDLFTVFRASCSIPLISPIVEYNKSFYLDGGVSNSIPLDRARELGYDKIVVVLTKPINYRKDLSKSAVLMEKVYSNYPNLISQIKMRHILYNARMKKIEELEANGDIVVIRPSEDFKISRIERDDGKLSDMYFCGLKDGRVSIEKIIEYVGDDDLSFIDRLEMKYGKYCIKDYIRWNNNSIYSISIKSECRQCYIFKLEFSFKGSSMENSNFYFSYIY